MTDYSSSAANVKTALDAVYVKKSSTSGLLKNDGSIDTTSYLSSLPSHNHDDRYYTETETDTLLQSKANIDVTNEILLYINNINNSNCLFFDNANSIIHSTANWFVRSADTTDLTVTIGADGTLLSNASTTTSRYYFANPQLTSGDAPPITISNFIVECDVISTTFGTGCQIAFLLQGLGTSFNLSGYTAPYHIKIEKNGTSAKQYIDDTLIRTATISDRTTYYMGYQIHKTGSIKFKNYKITSL